MMFNVLKHYHVMIGIPILEWHQAIFPPVMAPKPKVMHMCGAMLCIGPWGVLTGKPNPTEISASGGVMLSQGTDIGPFIPHYNMFPFAPPNALLPIIFLCSGSKSHFGAHAHTLPKGPTAFACAVKVNFNLNCAGPAAPPLPSGLVFTFNTHVTGATIGDLVAGGLHLVFDLLVQWGLNRLFARAGVTELTERIAQGILGPFLKLLGVGSVSYLVGQGLGKWAGAAAEEFLFALPGTLPAVFGPGSPLGYSPGYSPDGGSDHWWNLSTYTDPAHGGVQRAVDNYFNKPSVEQHPSQAPPAPAPPPPNGVPVP
jgi:hypothetical protein